MSVIRDKYGEEYQIEVEPSDSGYSVGFDVMSGRRRVGRANCTLHGDTLCLADIRMEDNAIRAPRFYNDYFGFAVSFPPQWWRSSHPDNFQKRGLGTALLDFLIAYAQSNGFKRIEGKLVGSDCEKNPHLPQWYRNMGFKVVMDAQSGKPNGIHLNL